MISKRFQILSRLHTFVQSKEPLIVKSLQVIKHGNPIDVLQIQEEKLTATSSCQVLLKILAAPIHPIHIEFIKGEKSTPATKFPFVPGTECVAEIASIGENVRELTVGQRVIVPYADTISERGTWSTYALYNYDDVVPIPEDIGIPEAATLSVYPFTAYRILKDFVTLNAGDCVLFNGGNSGLGHAMHQLCKAWNLNSVSVVRPGADVYKDYLKSLGATEVFTPKELLESTIFEDGTLPKPRLSLSCVARSSSRLLGKYLNPDGLMVTYGYMAGYPVTAVTTAFVFKDFVHRPFWIMRWNKSNPAVAERNCMIDELCSLIKSKKFRAPEMECIPFAQYKDAFEKMLENKGASGKKFLLDMSSEK